MGIKLSLHVRIARKYCQNVEIFVVDSKYLKIVHIVVKIFLLFYLKYYLQTRFTS